MNKSEETLPDFWKRCARDCILALVFRYLTDQVSIHIDPLLCHAEWQALVISSVVISVSELSIRLEIYTTETQRVKSMIRGMAFTVPLLVAWLALHDTPFEMTGITSTRTLLLVHYYLLRKLLPGVCRHLDQQVTDIRALGEIGLASLQTLLYLHPLLTIWAANGISLTLMVVLKVMGPAYVQRFWFDCDFGAVKRLVHTMVQGICSIVGKTTVVEQLQIGEMPLGDRPIFSLNGMLPLRDRQIRLLKLHRKSAHGHLECEMFTASVDEDIAYEAVSHTWQRDGERQEISINKRYRLSVPSRIHDLLSHRQSWLSSRMLWIDSVCIDQENLDEREAQVRLMKEIFGRATKVVVWLATEKNLASASLAWNWMLWVHVSRLIGNSGEDVYQVLACHCPQATQALVTVLRHEWFSRMWVIQEIALARRILVLYRGHCLEWWEIEQFAVILDDSLDQTRDDGSLDGPDAVNEARKLYETENRFPDAVQTILTAKNIEIMSRARQNVEADRLALKRRVNSELPTLRGHTIHTATDYGKKHDFLSLEQLLTSNFSFDATDPRDRIFALLGMITDPSANLPLPDYHSSYRDVFRDVAKLLLTKGKHASQLLNRAGIGLRRDMYIRLPALFALPSWVPDFVVAGDMDLRVSSMPQVEASSLVLSPSEHKPDHLIAKVRILTSITSLAPAMYALEDESLPIMSRQVIPTSKWMSWLLEAKHLALTSSKDHRLDFDHAAFYRTLFANRYDEVSPVTDTVLENILEGEAVLKWYIDYRSSEHAGRGAGEIPAEQWDNVIRHLKVFKESFDDTTLGRRFGVTQQGRYILAPPLAKEHDVVCVFEGLRQPFLLRAHPRTDGIWRLVGSCLVDKFEEDLDRERLEFHEVALV